MKTYSSIVLTAMLCMAYNAPAAPLQWVCNWPDAKAQAFSLYQGETATFQPTFRAYGIPLTNATIEAVFYQTNGMGNAWWRLDNATFAPSNDVGASSYRFFVQARASDPLPNSQLPNSQTIYRANGTLRMLPSPGYVPNAIEPPVVTLDFATLTVLNAPWPAEISSAATAASNYTDSATVLTPVFSEWTIYRDGVDVTAQMQALPQWLDDSWSEGVFYRGYWNVWCYHSADDVVCWDIVYDPHATIITANSTDYFGGSHTYTATRQLLGYTLSGQTDKPLASTNAVSAAIDRSVAVAAQSATNLAIQAVSNAIEIADGRYRGVADEYVYESTGLSDFTWSGERADALAAIGTTQPYVGYSYDDYCEWNVEFEMDGNWFWGNAYDSSLSPRVEFYVYSEYWDDDLGDYVWDSFSLFAERTATGYQMTTPVDTFARQSALTRAVQGFNSMSNALIRGEYKRLRTGAPREYGSGWGYLQKPLNSDFRTWRIRAPRCTISSLAGSSGYQSDIQLADGTYMSNVPSMRDPWYYLSSPATSTGVDLVGTTGAWGSDSVELADFDFGVAKSGGNSPYLVRWRVEGVSRDPFVFRATPIVDGCDEREVIQNGGVTNTVVGRLVELPTASLTYNYSPYYRFQSRPIWLGTDPAPVLGTNSLTLALWTISLDSHQSGSQHTSVYSGVEVARRKNVTLTISSSQNSDYYLPEGRVVTDATSGLFYDDVAGGTYRMAVSNGCWFTEFVSDKDWRKEDIEQ